jgi:hypothetical protein
MARRGPALLLLLSMAGSAGCGTTQVLTTEPTARVVADGQTLGRGQGRLTRRGFPGSTNVVARTDDGRQGELLVRREFTALTLVLGLVTYGVCLIACWEYPDTVMIPLPPAPGAGYPAPPGTAPAGIAPAGPVDPWLQPPAGWTPPSDKPAS